LTVSIQIELFSTVGAAGLSCANPTVTAAMNTKPVNPSSKRFRPRLRA
jgi:hypothetical protein